MPEYLSPGVYVEEASSGIRPIEGVGTSTGAFIGVAEKGPIGGARYEDGPGRPVLITNFGDFTRTFGGFINGEFLAYAVQQFFGEGGTRCYVTRTAHFENSSDPTTLTATRAFWPSRGMPPTPPPPAITLTAPLAAGATVASLSSLAGISDGTVLYINDGTNAIRVRVNGLAAPNVTFDPPVPAASPIALPATVTPVVMLVNAINEGEWGNNLSVSVSVSGRVATTLSAAMAAGATTADLASIVGIDVGMTLLLAQGADFALVQVTLIDPGLRQITFRVIESSVAPPTVPLTGPAMPIGATVTGTILGRASTVLQAPAANGAFDALLASTEGITVGSILIFVSRTLGAETVSRVVVNRVLGNRVFFAAPGLTAAFTAGPLPGTPITIVTSEDFAITVLDGGEVVETHANLSLENTNVLDYVEDRINLGATRSRYIRVDESQLLNAGNTPPDRTPGPRRLGGLPGTGGTNGAPDDQGDYTGNSAVQTGFFAFDTVDDINILAAPGITLRPVILAGLTYCENRTDAFYVAETPPGTDTATAALDFKNATGPFTGQQAFNSKYGAIYWPWVRVFDPLTNRPLLMAPSGAIVGSFSATDVRRGVHKAPAGIEDGFLNTAIGIEKVVTKGEHDVLNPQGINVIRSFPGLGIVIWGARTVSKDPEWRYVNVRRLFLFLEESIDEGTQWVVFEPNDPVLWARIIRNVSAFLRVQWLEGKLVGTKEEDAFFVKCDEETNPPESVDLGRVITVIGVAPSKPAEFVIFRIMQKRPGE
jgi:phage tail sheath protein FI